MPTIDSQPRALIIEDDAALAEVLALALHRHAWTTVAVHDGGEGLEVARGGGFDLVLLDVLLPTLDGLEICRRIRASSQVPIIVITAKSQLADVIDGLDCGADDYLTKPFEVEELMARVRAVTRRAPARPGDRIVVGDLDIAPGEVAVRKRGAEVSLTATEFRLLVTLASAPHQVFSREELLQRVWGWDYLGGTGIVNMAVKRLRDKIEDDPSDPRIIETVRGFGYRLVPR